MILEQGETGWRREEKEEGARKRDGEERGRSYLKPARGQPHACPRLTYLMCPSVRDPKFRSDF